MSIINVGNVLTIDDLIALEEMHMRVDQTLPDGSISKIEQTERIGPLLLGYDSVSTIAPHRADKPVYYGRPEFNRDQLKRIMARFGTQEDPIDRKDFDERLDLFLAGEGDREAANCPFCYHNLEQRAENSRGIHPDTTLESGKPVMSVTSMNPFMDDHLVTIFAGHHINRGRYVDLASLTFEDMENYFVSAAQIAQGYRDRGGIAMLDFANLGDDAGNSVRHAHTHRGKITSMNSYWWHSKRARLFNGLNGDGVNAMERLMKNIENSPLFIFKNGHVFIYAAWAPKYDHHVEVIFNNPEGENSGNVTAFHPKDLRTAARSLLAAFRGLGDLGVRAANFVTHQSTFSGEPRGYRMQAELYQRTSRYDGAYDTGGLGRVVHTVPEQTAVALKKCFK